MELIDDPISVMGKFIFDKVYELKKEFDINDQWNCSSEFYVCRILGFALTVRIERGAHDQGQR